MLGNVQLRAKLLRLAVDQHRQYTNEARNPGVSYYSRQGWGEGGGGRYRGMGGGGGLLGNVQQRAKLLRLAVDQHRQYTNEARNP